MHETCEESLEVSTRQTKHNESRERDTTQEGAEEGGRGESMGGSKQRLSFPDIKPGNTLGSTVKS